MIQKRFSSTVKPKTRSVCTEASFCTVELRAFEGPGDHPDWTPNHFPLWIILGKNENACPLTAGRWPQNTPRCPQEVCCATMVLPLSPLGGSTGGRKGHPAGPSHLSRSGQLARRSKIYEAHGLHVTNVPCPEVPPWAQLCMGTKQGSM